jgi:hypothetical protein
MESLRKIFFGSKNLYNERGIGEGYEKIQRGEGEEDGGSRSGLGVFEFVEGEEFSFSVEEI